MTATRAGSTKRWPQSCSGERERAAQHSGDRGRDEDTRRDVPEAADRDDRDREHREDHELTGGERDRVEVLREVPAHQDPDPEENGAGERERVARVESQRGSLEQEEPDDRAADRERRRCATASGG